MYKQIRAKLSRLPFKRRVMAIASVAGAGWAYEWRRSLGDLDESLVKELATPSQSNENRPSPSPSLARAAKWEQLEVLSKPNDAADKVLDLIVIGAGANGLFITLEAARRGMSVATFDACDIGGATSSSTPNLLATFLPHLYRAIKILSFEELRTASLQLAEVRKMQLYTARSHTPVGDSPIVSSDVGMAVPTAARAESFELFLTSLVWVCLAKVVGSPSPLGDALPLPDVSLSATQGSGLTLRESLSASGYLPYRSLPPRLFSLVSDWVGGGDLLDPASAKQVPSSVFYFRHSRIDGTRMSMALATTAERLQTRKGSQLDHPIILNYCPVRSVEVDPATGFFKVEVKNSKPATGRSGKTAKNGHTVTLLARNVVNSTGPWVDSLRVADIVGDVGPATTDAEALALAGTPSTSTSTVNVATRRLVRETAPEKATGYAVRQHLQSKDFTGAQLLTTNSNGHVYFAIPTASVTTGFVKESAKSSHVARQINSVMTLTSDAGRRYITISPFTNSHSLIGLSTVALPQLGWRDQPSASGLPFSDPSHFSQVYRWLRSVASDTGIRIPEQPSSCILSASGTLAPLSTVAREVHVADVAVEAVKVGGLSDGSSLYHVVGGNWLTARNMAVDVVRDIRRRHLEATTEPASTKVIDGKLEALEAPYALPLALAPTNTLQLTSTEPTVASMLTSAMAADPFVTCIIDVIARRTQLAYTHHAQIQQVLPALVQAMGSSNGAAWSTARMSEELASARWFLDGIAPPQS